MSWLSSAGRGGVSELQDLRGQIAAIGKSNAVIEFKLDGTILSANENFLVTVGYTLTEVQGKHHSMFVDPVHARSPEYRQFWEKLGRGEFDSGRYKRIAKGGKEIWIQASYNAILDRSGRPFKVVKFATDITEQKIRDLDVEGQLAAINKAQAVIEFTPDGTIVTANQNFLGAVGYSLDEICGRHHGMFVEPAYAQSTDYREFWAKLGRGEFDANQYKRIGKGGKEIWIQASYNPIFDANGKVFKVVKIRNRRDRHGQGRAADAGRRGRGQEQRLDATHSARGQERRHRPVVRGGQRTPGHDGGHPSRHQDGRERGLERIVGDFRLDDRPVAAHGGAGGEPGTDLGLDGADVGNGEEERRERGSRRTSPPTRPRRSPIAAARWYRRRSARCR